MKYTKHYNTKKTAQSQAIPGKKMVENNAGGYVFQVDDWERLNRFLILGSEGGSYYVRESKLTTENADAVVNLIKQDGERVVERIVEVSTAGKAPKNDPAIFALALATTFGNANTKKAAYNAITSVCRIGTHLFTFCQFIQDLRGWSRGLRTGVARFYLGKSADKIAYQCIKYRQRNGWTHRDVLRLSHPKTAKEEVNDIFGWIVGSKSSDNDLIRAFEKAQTLGEYKAGTNGSKKDVKVAVELIKEYRLPWEALPTELLKEKEVWTALLPDMPLGALVRNLGRLASMGIADANTRKGTKVIIKRLTDKESIKRSRIHPINVLMAMKTYASGHGFRGNMSWNTASIITDALDHMFHLSFANVEKTGKNYYLGVDVSGSMTHPINNSNVTCMEAAAAMAMATARVEDFCEVKGFCAEGSSWSGKTYMKDLSISKNATLQKIVDRIRRLTFGGTDCALPILDAMDRDLEIDTFVVYTDNETWAGSIHPTQALQAYRKKTGINAKLIVVGMISNGFTIADPNDAGMLDVVGFDTSVPQIIAQFSAD